MPILGAIEGRFEDICVTPDGREMLRFDTVFKGVDTMREAQVVQGELESFTINVVPVNGFSAHDIERIKHNMRLYVGNVQTHVKSVDVIPRTPSGQFRAVICKLSPQDKRRVGQINTDETAHCEP